MAFLTSVGKKLRTLHTITVRRPTPSTVPQLLDAFGRLAHVKNTQVLLQKGRGHLIQLNST